MRVILTAQIPTEAGNPIIQNPNFLKNIENYIKKFNVEASYFTDRNGDRTLIFIFDLSSSDMVPAVVEPMFQEFSAKVEIHPAMNLEDLKKAISGM